MLSHSFSKHLNYSTLLWLCSCSHPLLMVGLCGWSSAHPGSHVLRVIYEHRSQPPPAPGHVPLQLCPILWPNGQGQSLGCLANHSFWNHPFLHSVTWDSNSKETTSFIFIFPIVSLGMDSGVHAGAGLFRRLFYCCCLRISNVTKMSMSVDSSVNGSHLIGVHDHKVL